MVKCKEGVGGGRGSSRDSRDIRDSRARVKGVKVGR